MKTLFGMTAAVLMVVSLLFVSLPGTAVAADMTIIVHPGETTKFQTVKTKKAADEALQAVKAQAEKAKTDEEKRIAKQLVKQATINAEVAGDLLEAVKAGKDINLEEVRLCDVIAKKVKAAAKALAAGDTGKAEDALDRIAELESDLLTAAEMQGAWADAAGKNQTAASVDTKCIKWEEVCSLKEKKECQSLASPSSIATEHCTVVWQRECQQKCIVPCSRSRHRHWSEWSCWQ